MLQLSFAAEKESGPLYDQLYHAIVEQIREGQLKPGERLPGKRNLASSLAVSVNTVDTAYQLLVAEGYLEARPRSGFFVQQYQGPKAALPHHAPEPAAVTNPTYFYDLSTGAIDTSLFPFRTWSRIQKELLYSQPQLLNRGDPQGDADLRAAIADYLRAYRAVDCQPDQIVVGAGVEYLLGLLAHLVEGPAAVEDPGYQRPQRILQNSGIPCIPLPIDAMGLNTDALYQTDAKMVYVTPSHQFPTGVVMPAGRRAELVQWAMSRPGRYIIEDDYDSEFRFELRPLPSLQGMAGSTGPVVYLSTFSRSLAPSIRIACMVLPRSLLPRFQRDFGFYSSTVSRFEQQTLRIFLQEGHFTRHLARCRNQYRGRMQLLTRSLEQTFGPDALHFSGQHTGLHLLLQIKNGPGEAALLSRARQAGINLTGLSEYCTAADCPPNTLVAGYGGLHTEQIEPLAALLAELWH